MSRAFNTGAGGYGVFGGGGIAGVFGTSDVGGNDRKHDGIGVLGVGSAGVGGSYGGTGRQGLVRVAWNIVFPGGMGRRRLGAATVTAVYAVRQVSVPSGSKNFVEPHPTDPSKEIRYASLEGREVGTYFRGTAPSSAATRRSTFPTTSAWSRPQTA